jgi:hypothetical protein
MDAYNCVTRQPCVCLCDKVAGSICKVGAEFVKKITLISVLLKKEMGGRVTSVA